MPEKIDIIFDCSGDEDLSDMEAGEDEPSNGPKNDPDPYQYHSRNRRTSEATQNGESKDEEKREEKGDGSKVGACYWHSSKNDGLKMSVLNTAK